jgi:Flp pilus assembly protein TadG
MIHFKNRRQTKCRGTAMIWIVVSFGVLCMFCGLAVDLGRAQTVKTELRRAADAAARAAAAELANGGTDGQIYTAAYQVAYANSADGIAGVGVPVSLRNPVQLNTSTGRHGTITGSADIQIGNWNFNTRTFTVTSDPSQRNAVRVYARRNGDYSYQPRVPLIFTRVLGINSTSVWASSVVAIQVVDTVTVGGTSNLWLAGTENLPPGTVTASVPDSGYPSSKHLWQNDINGPPGVINSTTGEPYDSPPMVPGLLLQPGDLLTVSDVTGTVGNDGKGGAMDSATGGTIYNDTASHPGVVGGKNHNYIYDENEPPQSNTPTGETEHNISDLYAPINSLTGVFLDDKVPDQDAGHAPTEILNFSGTGSNPTRSSTYLKINNYTDPNTKTVYTVTAVSQDYTNVSPKLLQSFYVGSGQNSSGTQQTITVPVGATRLYLGTMDGHEWSNNVGSFTGTVTQKRIVLVQ